MDDVGGRDDILDAMTNYGRERWREARLAIDVLTLGGPAIGGLLLTARAGGLRDAFFERLAESLAGTRSILRMPPGMTASGLMGRIDIATTASTGRTAWQNGMLAKADGGLVVVPMAERLDLGAAAILAETMDSGVCPDTRPGHDRPAVASRFVVVAIDESSEAEEAVPRILADRLGLHVNLDAIPYSVIAPAADTMSRLPQTDWRQIDLPADVLRLLCEIAAAAGHASHRAEHLLTKVSRIVACLAGRDCVTPDDAATALKLSLGIRLMNAPAPEEEAQEQEQPEPPPQPPESRDPDSPAPETPDADDVVQSLSSLTELLNAVEQGTIDGLSLAVTGRPSRGASQAGKAGMERKNVRRGRPAGEARTAPFPDARPDIIATLRAAAPWQMLRARLVPATPRTDNQENGRPNFLIRKDDFRFHRLKHKSPSTAIFVVDASGSTALERLGETKGAIEQLLATCYVRRDEVALIAFRGLAADITMAPTRSLVMAKRKLSALPGGGPTPLASGLQKGLEMALAVRRRGSTPVVVLMTDGSGNIDLDGQADRAKAAEQTSHLARLYRAQNLRTICIDIARRPREAVTTLASSLGADLHVLRQADAARMSQLVNTSMQQGQP